MKTRQFPLGDRNVVGAKVTALRLQKKLKQKDLLAKLQADGMDLSPSCLSKIEGQTKQVSDKDLLYLAKALGVSPTDLLPS